MPFWGSFGPPNVEKLKAKQDVQGLIKALTYQKDGAIRKAAVEALAEIGGTQAVEPLIAMLRYVNKDGYYDYNVQKSAAHALGELRDTRAVEPLIVALKIKEDDVRVAAVRALGELRDTRAVEPLMATLKDSHWRVRQAAAQALGAIGDVRAVEPLIIVVKDKGWFEVQEAAVLALRQIGDTRAVEPFLDLVSHESVDICVATIEALVAFGDVRAVKPLNAALGRQNSIVRKTAEQALANFLKPEEVKRLSQEAEENRKRNVQESISRCIKGLREDTSVSKASYVNIITEYLKHSATDIDTDTLRELSALDGVAEIVKASFGEMTYSPERRKAVDCSLVRQLARKELLFRGEKV